LKLAELFGENGQFRHREKEGRTVSEQIRLQLLQVRFFSAVLTLALLNGQPRFANAAPCGGGSNTLISPNPEISGRFGRSLAGIEDIDGDGRGDILVGASQEDPGASPADAGRVYLISGATLTVLATFYSPNEEAGGLFGRSVSSLPDVDGDGLDDIVIGANFEDPGSSPTDSGRAYIFLSSTRGTSNVVWATLKSPNETQGGLFGTSVAGVPDVDGDSRGDVVVGAFLENPNGLQGPPGRAYLFSGANGILLATYVSPHESFVSVGGARFGFSVAGSADLDGDGRGEIIIGADFDDPNPSARSGRAYLFSGADRGVSSLPLTEYVSPNEPKEEGVAQFGISVTSLGDLNFDGLPDIAVGAPLEDVPGYAAAGRVYLFSASARGVTSSPFGSLASPVPRATGIFGWPVSSVPDMDSDGVPDILVGASREETAFAPPDNGRAYVFSGASRVLRAVLVSGHPEPNAFFGEVAAGVPDINGDGHGDAIVAGYFNDDPAGLSDSGAVYVFTLSANDCDGDGIYDADEDDCLANGVPDDCEIALDLVADANANCVPDNCPGEPNAVPTVSDWGITVMTLLLLIAGSLVSTRLRAVPACSHPVEDST
jgi:hypothetical protein